jgi:hypothetical protein
MADARKILLVTNLQGASSHVEEPAHDTYAPQAIKDRISPDTQHIPTYPYTSTSTHEDIHVRKGTSQASLTPYSTHTILLSSASLINY